MNNIIKKINDARLDIFMRDPFLGYVLQHYEIYIKKNVETAYTNGKYIVIGEKFLKKRTHQETMFILLHELLHIILGHIQRSKGYNQLKFNVACDIIVNDIIHSYLYSYGNLNPQFGINYKINSFNKTAESMYDILPNDFSQDILDYHDVWTGIKQSDLKKSNRELQNVIQEAITKGYSMSNQLLIKRLSDISYAKNKHRWSHILEKYITKGLYDYNYEKTDYRYQGVLLPSFTENEQALKNIWFLVDVSSSMSDELVSMMLGEIERIISHFKSISCDVSFFSNKTTEPVRFTNSKMLLDTCKNIKSTGGTDIKQIFTSLDKYYRYEKPKLMIILTDGYASYPDESKAKNIPVFWVTDNKRVKIPFGNKILIE